MTTLTYIAVLCLLLTGCPGAPSSDVPDHGVDDKDIATQFEDHTVSSFGSTQAFHAWADIGNVPQQVKFTLTRFSEEDSDTHFYDPRFYAMHDEWYWFRLLNGEGIAGFPVMPVPGFSFDTIDEAYEILGKTNPLPLDLRTISSGRIYSPLFYDAGLGRGDFEDGRFFGLGSLLYYPADPARTRPDALYCFELEYVDNSDEEGVIRFYEKLREALPTDIAEQLHWLSRGSTHQDALAEEIRAGNGILKDRVLTYADLVVPGEHIPYNEGITAGRVKLFEEPVGASQVSSRDIVILSSVPDYLPPVSGIVTAVPQTPLAHLNLLAKARGTPNIHIGGIFTHEWLNEWAYWKTPVILKVEPTGGTWQAMTNDQYSTYLSKLIGSNLTIEAIDLTEAPYIVDLSTGGLAGMGELVPLTGGKAAGMRAFTDFPDIETPLKPTAMTIRGYKEHLKSYLPMLEEALSDETFQNDGRVRFVFFEGKEDFLEEHAADPEAALWLNEWLDENGPLTTLGGAVAVGGFKALLRSKPLDEALNALVMDDLKARYAELSPMQGIRFRSSSTAEDIKGFNGAGLYDSNTGYMDPSQQPTEKLQQRSIEWALKKTWASYWAYEAFEEREIAGIDHLSGNMGVLVHPRFDDPMERSNGVITLTLKREKDANTVEMVVNVQKGAISVTNPDPKNPTTPEINMVIGTVGEEPQISRVQVSSEVPANERVLSDEVLLETYYQLTDLAQAWLNEENKAWPPTKRSSTLVLDLEFKEMTADWPQMQSGETFTDRMILKQVRTLENAIRVEEGFQNEPTPRDILSITRRIDARTCTSSDFEMTILEFYTENAKKDLLDYSKVPFVNRMLIEFKEDVPGFNLKAGTFGTVHTAWESITLGNFPSAPWELDIQLKDDAETELGFQRLTVTTDGLWTLFREDSSHQGQVLTCEVETLSVGPSEYLESLLTE